MIEAGAIAFSCPPGTSFASGAERPDAGLDLGLGKDVAEAFEGFFDPDEGVATELVLDLVIIFVTEGFSISGLGPGSVTCMKSMS